MFERNEIVLCLQFKFGHVSVRTLIETLFVFVESNEAIKQGSDSYHSPSSSSSLSEFMGTTPSYGQSSDDDGETVPVDVEVHCEVTTQDGPPIPIHLVKNICTIVQMARTKQTAKKQGTQGSPAKFGGGGGGGKGPLKGKAAKQLAAKQLVAQTATVGARRRRCKHRCPVMPRGAPDDTSTEWKKRYLPGKVVT